MSDDHSKTGTSVNTLQTEDRALKALVNQWAWRERRYYSANGETTPTGYYLCGALEKLIRLLILVAIWVRWSHKGIHILRINKDEWQRAQLLHKNLHGPKLPTARGVAVEEHTRGKTVWQIKGLSPYEIPGINLFAASWRDVAGTEISSSGVDSNFSFLNQLTDARRFGLCKIFQIKCGKKGMKERSLKRVITGSCKIDKERGLG